MIPADTLSIALQTLTAHPNWFIFPIKRGEKFPPLFERNLELASNNPLQIRKMHAKWPGCNWGLSLAKSKLIVVDGDMKPGKVGEQTLENLFAKHGRFPDTYIVRTPSGGFHFYFDEANGIVHKCRLGANGFGLDVDSPNYVLLAGCGLLDGTMYEAINDAPLAPSPAWFGLYLAETKTTDADQAPVVDLDTDAQTKWAIDFLTTDARPSIQGQNGEWTLLMTAGALKDHGISEDAAVELLLEHYNPRCEPAWGAYDGPVEDRLDVKVHNAWLYLKQTQPGAFTAAAEFDEDGEPEEPVADWIEWWTLRDKEQADARDIAARKSAEATMEARAAIDAFAFAPERDVWETDNNEPAPLFEEAAEDDFVQMPDRHTPFTIALDKIDESAKPKADKAALNTVCNWWVWITGLERWVNRRDPTIHWKVKQFDSEYNYLLSKGASISNHLFKLKDTVRRFRYLAFCPGRGEFNGVEYNVWRPSPITPKEGDTTLWNEHLNNLFQDINDKNAVLNWMAWIVQNESRKPNHALLVVGRYTGTGKSYLARVMEQIVGESNTQRPKNSSMGGDFNSWLVNCRLCIIEEMYQVNRRENFNALRDLITEPTVEVNIKGIPAFTIPNYSCMMGISNHPDALPIDEYDRRWMVIETNAQPQDSAYYDRLFEGVPKARGMKPLNPDMVPAILYELKNRDIKAFPFIDKDGNAVPYDGYSRPPETKAKTNMIELARTDAETWLIENKGNIPMRRNVIQISDIVEAMPPMVQRTPRLASSVIPNFLRDKMGGVRHFEQVRLNDGRKVRVWVLHNRYSMTDPATLGALYEKERGSDNKKMDAEWAEEDSGS